MFGDKNERSLFDNSILFEIDRKWTNAKNDRRH